MEIVKGRNIGKSGAEASRNYTWVVCPNCGYGRYVQVRNGEPRNLQCFACSSASIERRRKVGASIKKLYENPEYKANIVLHSKRRWEDKSYREKMGRLSSERQKGKQLSDATKQKISLAQRRRFTNPDERAKISDFWRQLWLEEDYRQLMSSIRKGRVISDEQRIKLSNSMRGKQCCLGYKYPLERRLRHSKILKQYCQDESVRQRLAETSRVYWANISEDAKNKHTRSTILSNHLRPTFPEEKVLEAIKRYDLLYIYNGENAGMVICGKCPDFVNINGVKAIIEVYGDYWHMGEDEDIKKNLYAQYGYKTLILWESHIKESGIDELAQEILAFTKA